MRVVSPLARRTCLAGAVAGVLGLALAACSDDAAPQGDDPDETDRVCAVIPEEVVAEAVGIEVERTDSSMGGGTTAGAVFSSRSCSYELASAEGGEVSIRRYLQPSGEPFDVEELERWRVDSEDGLIDDFPHEDVDDLGDGAFFSADPFENVLVVHAGGHLVEMDGEIDGEPIDRATLLVLGEAVAEAFEG